MTHSFRPPRQILDEKLCKCASWRVAWGPSVDQFKYAYKLIRQIEGWCLVATLVLSSRATSCPCLHSAPLSLLRIPRLHLLLRSIHLPILQTLHLCIVSPQALQLAVDRDLCTHHRVNPASLACNRAHTHARRHDCTFAFNRWLHNNNRPRREV